MSVAACLIIFPFLGYFAWLLLGAGREIWWIEIGEERAKRRACPACAEHLPVVLLDRTGLCTAHRATWERIQWLEEGAFGERHTALPPETFRR